LLIFMKIFLFKFDIPQHNFSVSLVTKKWMKSRDAHEWNGNSRKSRTSQFTQHNQIRLSNL
jgi:hypothetical protein